MLAQPQSKPGASAQVRSTPGGTDFFFILKQSLWMRIWAASLLVVTFRMTFPKNAPPPPDHHQPSELTHRIGPAGRIGLTVWAGMNHSKNGIHFGNAKQNWFWLRQKRGTKLFNQQNLNKHQETVVNAHNITKAWMQQDAKAGKIWSGQMVLNCLHSSSDHTTPSSACWVQSENKW
jgi:hypothetical protein